MTHRILTAAATLALASLAACNNEYTAIPLRRLLFSSVSAGAEPINWPLRNT